MRHGYVSLLCLALGFNPCNGQTLQAEKDPAINLWRFTTGAKQKEDASNPFSANLEQMVAEAFKNNPDLRVAEIRSKEAEAQLLRTRLQVIAEITTLHAELLAAEAALKEANVRYEQTKKLFGLKAVSTDELQTTLLALMKSKSELAVKQARMPYLLGRRTESSAHSAGSVDAQALKKWQDMKIDSKGLTDVDFLRRVMLDVMGRLPTEDEKKHFFKMPEGTRRSSWINQHIQNYAQHAQRWPFSNSPEVHGHWDWIVQPSTEKAELSFKKLDVTLSEKLRKALDATIKMKGDNLRATQVMDLVREKLPGINVHVRVKRMQDNPIALMLGGPIPVGAFLQYLEDEMSVVFILRDYGVVLVSAEERLPPGALRVIDFWKRSKASDSSAAISTAK